MWCCSFLFAWFLAFHLSLGGVLKDFESPPFTAFYQLPLPIPPIKEPKMTVTDPQTGKPIKYFEIEIKELSYNFYPDHNNVTLVGYDGIVPGPTFMMERGTTSLVRFINNATMANSVHLHGSYSKSPWDGWADDITKPGNFKDYYYPNNQSARLLWYHDHAVDITSVNAYFGQFGAYYLHDPAEDSLNLPSGYGEFDIPLMIGTKQFNSDYSLFNPADETTSLYGDIVTVNGQPWPFLDVLPRKYRFRFLNVGDSRTFHIFFQEVNPATQDFKVLKDSPAVPISFNMIATDSGLIQNPVETDFFYISIAERYEVVFDFAPFAGKNIMLRSTPKVAADTDYAFTDQLMMFNVAADPVDDPSELPAVLNPAVPFPVINNTIATPNETFTFARKGGEWRINGVGWDMVDQRILSNVPRGTTEIWQLVNGGGGWSHPIHVHLVDMHVIHREGFDRDVEPWELLGLKDVVWIGPGETAYVEAGYQPWDGLYMFHCHNLIHEDHDMLAAFNVTKLVDLGYNETSFIDPMEERWQAEPSTPDKFTDDAIVAKIKMVANLRPYADIVEVEQALQAYWRGEGDDYQEGIPPGDDGYKYVDSNENEDRSVNDRVRMRKVQSRKELAGILSHGGGSGGGGSCGSKIRRQTETLSHGGGCGESGTGESTEPGDDDGNTTEPGDDDGTTPEPGDDDATTGMLKGF